MPGAPFFPFSASITRSRALLPPHHPPTTPCSVRRYKAPTVSGVVLFVVGVSWMTAMSVVALVPIDVYTSLSGAKAPAALDVLWSLSYW